MSRFVAGGLSFSPRLFREVSAPPGSLRQKGLRISAAHPFESSGGNGASKITQSHLACVQTGHPLSVLTVAHIPALLRTILGHCLLPAWR
jgi:hypothetical protein